MEHYIFYCKLSLLAVLSLITACCMLSRRWYVNLAAFLAWIRGRVVVSQLACLPHEAAAQHSSVKMCIRDRHTGPYVRQ